MTQTDTQYRDLAGKRLDGIDRDTCLGGGAWSRRNHDLLRGQGGHILHGNLIIAHDVHLGTQLTEVLHHVVGEGI